MYTKFEASGSLRSWEICNEKKILERKKNGQIKNMISMRTLFFSYTIQEIIPNVYTKFQNPRWSRSWEIFDERFYWRKEKWTNKGNDKHEDADSFLHDTSDHTQCLYQNSKFYSWEIFDTNLPMHYAGVRYEKKKKKGKKKSKEISVSWISFTQDTSTLCMCI